MDKVILSQHDQRWTVLLRKSEPFPFESTHPVESKEYWDGLLQWDMENRAFHKGEYHFYLHQDGRWLQTTHGDNGWTGYFDTKEQAVEAIHKAGINEWEDHSKINWSDPTTWPSSMRERMKPHEESKISEPEIVVLPT